MLGYSEIDQRYKELKDKITSIAQQKVNIIAVTKGFPEKIYSVCARIGIDGIGENKLQELERKAEAGFDRPHKFDVHFIGHLQTNKIKLLGRYASHFDTLSSEHQLKELEKFWEKNRLTPIPVLLQINSSDEPAKQGISIGDKKEIFRMLRLCQESDHALFEGLMTMGPTPQTLTHQKPLERQAFLELTRQCFIKVRDLKNALEEKLGTELPRLSMGMSHDFEIALKEGANEIRIGSALFGARNPV